MNDRPAVFFLRLLGLDTTGAIDTAGAKGASAGEIDLRNGGKLLIVSDFHMGNGRRDDFERNGGLVGAILDKYYFERGYTLVLNGDIEELLKCSLPSIRAQWKNLYQIFDRFNEDGRLYKIIGNHDAELVRERSYPYALYEAVTVHTPYSRIYIYHGHQGSSIYSRFNKQIAGLVRHVLKPFGIGNITSARSPRKRFAAEKRAYDFSLENGVISVIGHTHRSLFESLGRFEFIKYEIEHYCREYPHVSAEKRALIKKEVATLRTELAKLGNKERRDILEESLYGGDVPAPCLFNAGCAIGKKGINAIELDSRAISLVYWWKSGQGKKFAGRGNYALETLSAPVHPAYTESAATYHKVTLNTETLENIHARIELLR